MKPRHAQLRGFTLIEVMLATLLLGIVGVAIVTFLSAFATGGAARRQMSDAALEATLAGQRFRSLVPRFRCMLRVSDRQALVWTSDLVPSRTVHTSEAGILWFDDAHGELVLEIVDPAKIAFERGLEREYSTSDFDELVLDLDRMRAEGSLLRSILAEGLEGVEFEADPAAAGGARLTFVTGVGAASITIAPSTVEEPFG